MNGSKIINHQSSPYHQHIVRQLVNYGNMLPDLIARADPLCWWVESTHILG